MPYARVAVETHTVAELEQIVAEWDDLIDKAMPGTRTHKEHVNARRHYARRLELAKEKAERQEREDKRDPRDAAREIVDRLMER